MTVHILLIAPHR